MKNNIYEFIQLQKLCIGENRFEKTVFFDEYKKMFPTCNCSQRNFIILIQEHGFFYKPDVKCNGIKGCFDQRLLWKEQYTYKIE